MDLGPRIKDQVLYCTVLYSRFRRYTDVILRLSKSTAEDLSVFIGFGSVSRSNWRNYIAFTWICIEIIYVLLFCYFDLGIILGRVSDRSF